MADLTTQYLGLQLRNPLVASASPLTGDLDGLRRLEDHGIAAVVLPSIFEEEILQDQQMLQQLRCAGECQAEVCGCYFPASEATDGYIELYLDLIARARASLDVPVIASLNGVSDSSWTDQARLFEQAGASAVELNLYLLPLDLRLSARDIEQRPIAIVRRVRQATDLPVAVKLNPFYSAFGQIAQELEAAGADALVLFNRLYHPDIDLLRLRPVHDLKLSQRHEMRLPMIWLAALHHRIKVSLAATTGVETADDVVRYLLVGADAVMTASALLRNGPEYAASLLDGLAQWLDARGFSSPDDIRGLLAQAGDDEAVGRQREQYQAELRHYYPPAFFHRS